MYIICPSLATPDTPLAHIPLCHHCCSKWFCHLWSQNYQSICNTFSSLVLIFKKIRIQSFEILLHISQLPQHLQNKSHSFLSFYYYYFFTTHISPFFDLSLILTFKGHVYYHCINSFCSSISSKMWCLHISLLKVSITA